MPEQRKTSDTQVRVTEVAEALVWCKVNCLTFTDPDSFITQGCRHCASAQGPKPTARNVLLRPMSDGSSLQTKKRRSYSRK